MFAVRVPVEIDNSITKGVLKKTAGGFPELVSDLIDNFDLVCLLTAFPKQSSIIIINNLTIFFQCQK